MNLTRIENVEAGSGNPRSRETLVLASNNKFSAAPLDWPTRLFGIAFASGCALACEILLTRLFSILFTYHYVFISTSIAICGLALGASLAAAPPVRAWLIRPSSPPVHLQLAGATTLLFAFGSGYLHLLGTPIAYALPALVPFALIGMFISHQYTVLPERSGAIYAADLVGAAAGTLMVLPLLQTFGVPGALYILAIGLAIAGWLTGQVIGSAQPSKTYGLITIAVFGLVLLVAPASGLRPEQVTQAPPDKTLYRTLQTPLLQANVLETRWTPFARLDLVELSDPSQRVIFTDGGAGSYMIRYRDNPGEVAFLKRELEYLPFTLHEGGESSVLILGAGAGKDVLLAHLAGAQAITAVEINPEIVQLTREHASYNGNILDLPHVRTIISDGRAFVEQTQERYDLIYLNVVYSQAAGYEGNPLAENYIYTVEAFQAYISILQQGGHLALVMHNALEGSRALLTALLALQKSGYTLSEALERAALLMWPSNNPFERTSILMVSNIPWVEEPGLDFLNASTERGLQPLYFPSVFDVTLRDLVLNRADIESFAANGDYDLRPTYDERPFFYQFEWGAPLILQNLLIVMSILLMIYFLFILAVKTKAPLRYRLAFFTTVLLLGLAYMLVFMPTVQRAFMLIGHPTLSLVITLISLLLGAGAGGLMSDRWKPNAVQVGFTCFALSSALVIFAMTFPLYRIVLLAQADVVRIAYVLLLGLCLGFLVGIPFPSVMRLARQKLPSPFLAFLWGGNALAAVLGSVVSVLLVMTIGFTWTLLIAAAFYMTASLTLSLGG